MERTALVTGCDRGLGQGFVKVLLEKGYKVFAGQFLPEWAELAELAKEHPKLRIIPLDIGSDESVAKVASVVKQETDHLDILINNAGIYKDESGGIFDEMNFDEMLVMYNINTLGMLRMSRAFVDLLLKGEQKRLVNISSEAGSIADNWRKKQYDYCMTKAAVNMQGAILQLQLKEFGVKVMHFHPGWVRSYITGTFNEKGTVDVVDSAKGIIRQVLEPQEIGEHPSYTDYQGKPLPW